MWAVNAPCPEFRVRTPSGAVGRADFRGSWLALLHCTRPCTPGCGACLDRFRQLGGRLAERHCRLLVALDEPDAALRGLLGTTAAGAASPVVVGTWETPEPAQRASTLFAVIDPHGIVRELVRESNTTPLPESVLLDHVNRALGQPPIEWHGRIPSAATTFGCVEWFDYDAQHAPGAGGTTPGQ